MNVKRLLSSFAVAAMLCTTLPYAEAVDSVAAASADYPVQQFLMAIADTDCNVNASGNALAADNQNGTSAEKWTLNYVSEGVFEIVSSESGQILTSSGSGVSLAQDVDGTNQRWRIDGVQKDYDGYYLYYNITSHADGKALTFSESTCTFSLADYSGETYQKYKINLDGCEGFAANAMCDEGEKACTIGGLFGKTVYADSDTELIDYLNSTEPLTVVLTGSIDMKSHRNTRIRDNKTLVGAYSGGKLIDCELRTNNEYGVEGDNPSDNIVIRNIDFLAKNERGRILVQIWSSRQIWIDHCTFNSELSRDRDEVGKFIWLNTPYDNYMDAKDRLRSIDYITISYCQFRNRFWTVAYGTQNSEITRDRTTLMYNWWDECVRRCPQLGNGNAHIYNNYYSGNDNGNDQSTDQIIGGDGCNIISQNCRFQSFSKGDCIIGGGGNQPYRDDGSYYSEKSSYTPQKLNFSCSNISKWYPAESNYGYTLLDAYNTNGTDTKDFCLKYSGRQSSQPQYVTDAALDHFGGTTYASPFLRHCDFSKKAAVMDTAFKYVIRNLGSGLPLSVEGGTGANGTNVCQSESGAVIWTLEDAGDGYYKICSEAGDGKTYLLDVADGKPDNGTNIGIWSDTASDAQLFRFMGNEDGTYSIYTKASQNKSCLGVNGGSLADGANIIQWQSDGTDSQKWYVQPKLDPITGTLIESLEPFHTEYYASWAIDAELAVGDTIYGDRIDDKLVTYAEIPEALEGAEYVVTPCDAKNAETELGVLTAAADITLYVGLDARVSGIPAWLADDWEKTDLQVKSSKDVVYILYAKELHAGEQVRLGVNGQSSGCVNYTIFAAEAEPEKIEGDVNADGQFSVSDAVMLQKWLLCVPDAALTDWQAADLCDDDKINAFDLCLLKRKLLTNK